MVTYNLPRVKGEYFLNRDLANFSFFKTGGKAEVLFFPEDQEDLIEFLQNIDDNIPINIIGAGSNLLIRDGLIKGIIINIQKLNRVKFDNFKIRAEGGALNSKVFNLAKMHNVTDFEFLGLIPGTIGGACRMNAGCYGYCIADILEYIKAVDFNGRVHIYSKEECKMQYRTNNLPYNLIFLEASFICRNITSAEDIQKKYKEMLNKKVSTQPISEKTCGSTFRNLPDMPAWKIIQDLKLQGVDFNGVRMSEKHANFLINTGNNTSSSDIENLIAIIRHRAKTEKNIDLELELKILG